MEEEKINRDEEMTIVRCPRCKTDFKLTWEGTDWDNYSYSLRIRGCPSGGIYDVSVSCPNCNHEESL